MVYLVLGACLIGMPFAFIQPYWLGFIFVVLYWVIPVFVYFIYFIIERIYYKNKPELTVHSNWFVERALCPKCQTGRIKYSQFRDGSRTKTYFICFGCETVYPQTYLEKFFPVYPPWSPKPSFERIEI